MNGCYGQQVYHDRAMSLTIRQDIYVEERHKKQHEEEIKELLLYTNENAITVLTNEGSGIK